VKVYAKQRGGAGYGGPPSWVDAGRRCRRHQATEGLHQLPARRQRPLVSALRVIGARRCCDGQRTLPCLFPPFLSMIPSPSWTNKPGERDRRYSADGLVGECGRMAK